MLDILGLEALSVSVPQGGWQQVTHPRPGRLLAALAGLEPASGQVVVDGAPVHSLPPAGRARAGLVTASGRLPALPGLRVLDVLLLGRSLDATTPWRAAAGSRRARARMADAEAWARALAGRLGIARWADQPASGLSDGVVALVDVGRAAASRPRAVVWRAPEWLDRVQGTGVEQALRREQAVGGWAVLEVRGTGRPARRGPVVVEIAD